jgi:dihydropyrimidinase
MPLVIKNGTLVTGEETLNADVLVDGETIREIGENLDVEGAQVIDARGKLVFPGGIDMHVHFNLFFCGSYSEDWDTSTAAAACGGVTTVIDYAIQQKGKTLKEAVEARIEDARDKAGIDYSLHGGITDWNEKTREEMSYYTANGIPSFKMFMIYRKEGWMADDGILFSALEESKKSGALIMLHAESAFVLDLLMERYHTPELMKEHGAYCHSLSRPCFTEYEAVQRAATWAGVTGGRVYIVHTSSSESADIIKRAKEGGVNIWGETCPQYLLFTDEVFKGENGHFFATCPQVKKDHDRKGLLEALKSGSLQVLATDTCTFTRKQKDMWGGDFTKIPYGLPGVETLMPTMFSFLVKEKGVSPSQFVSLVSTNPAKLFGLYPRKGALKAGSDADIVVFDPDRRVTIDHKNLATSCDWSPFQGMEVTGWPEITISRGEIVAKDGKFLGRPGRGRFLERKAGSVI